MLTRLTTIRFSYMNHITYWICVDISTVENHDFRLAYALYQASNSWCCYRVRVVIEESHNIQGHDDMARILILKRKPLNSAASALRETDPQSPPTEALAVSVTEATRITGISRSELYRRLATEQVSAIKSGKRTLILMESLRRHLASLPPATFRSPAKQV
jgi:hypothetical protein